MSEPDGAVAGGDAAPVETNIPDDVEVDSEAGDSPIEEEVKEIHRNRLDDRADTEGRDPTFRMVADDVSAISNGRLVGRPGGE